MASPEAMRFCDGGERLAWIDDSGRFWSWRWRLDASPAAMQIARWPFWPAYLGPGCRLALIGSDDSNLLLVDLDARLSRTVDLGVVGGRFRVGAEASGIDDVNGRLAVLVDTSPGEVRWLDPDRLTLLGRVPLESMPTAIEGTRLVGDRLLFVDGARRVCVANPAAPTVDCQREPTRGSTMPPELAGPDLSPDGRWLVVGIDGVGPVLMDANRPDEMQILDGRHAGGQPRFSPLGRWLAMSDWRGVELIDRVVRGASVRIDLGQHSVRAVEFSPDERWVAVGESDGAVSVWTTTGEPVARSVPIEAPPAPPPKTPPPPDAATWLDAAWGEAAKALRVGPSTPGPRLPRFEVRAGCTLRYEVRGTKRMTTGPDPFGRDDELRLALELSPGTGSGHVHVALTGAGELAWLNDEAMPETGFFRAPTAFDVITDGRSWRQSDPSAGGSDDGRALWSAAPGYHGLEYLFPALPAAVDGEAMQTLSFMPGGPGSAEAEGGDAGRALRYAIERWVDVGGRRGVVLRAEWRRSELPSADPLPGLGVTAAEQADVRGRFLVLDDGAIVYGAIAERRDTSIGQLGAPIAAHMKLALGEEIRLVEGCGQPVLPRLPPLPEYPRSE